MNPAAEFVEDIVLMELIIHRFNITGIDNIALAQEVLKYQDIKLSDNPNLSLNEDSLLETPTESEAFKLVTTVNALVEDRNLTTVGLWGLVNRPLESSNTHLHGNNPYVWVYYVKVPKNSGDLVFSFFDKFVCPITPEEGVLLIFPGWMYHSVSKNKSDEVRISISGNFNYIKDIKDIKL